MISKIIFAIVVKIEVCPHIKCFFHLLALPCLEIGAILGAVGGNGFSSEIVAAAVSTIVNAAALGEVDAMQTVDGSHDVSPFVYYSEMELFSL